MRKYLLAFKISFAHQLTYRFNFFVGRVRNIVVLILLYYVWFELSQKNGFFAGYTHNELMTYVFGLHVMRAFVFGAQSRRIAQEINDGSFSTYLTKPLNHAVFFYFRELAERLVRVASAVIEIAVFAVVLDVSFAMQTNLAVLAISAASLIAAHLLYYVLSYGINLIAFWSREALGPRFLFEWTLEFASGSFFPLSILARLIFIIVHLTPFAWLLFVPMQIYLGKISMTDSSLSLLVQALWIAVMSACTFFLFRAGLKRYTGEGI